jgi:hypothetical protein
VLQLLKARLLLVTFLLGFTFPAWPESYPHERPQVSVSVYNDAGVSATVLAAAERRAARIFDEAGVDVVWNNCSTSRTHVGPDVLVRAGEQGSPGILVGADRKEFGAEDQPKTAELRPAGRVGAPAPTRSDLDCASFAWPTRLAVRIAPRSASSAGEVFGVAFLSDEGTGCYSDVFYERALELHADWNVALSDILGNVMAHELGHLLQGSNSHSREGIMQAHWQGEQLHRLSRGNLWFTTEQASHMRGKLNGARQPVTLTASSSH